MTNWWKEHPNIKKALAEKLKKFYKKNPDKFKKFCEAGKNAFKLKNVI